MKLRGIESWLLPGEDSLIGKPAGFLLGDAVDREKLKEMQKDGWVFFLRHRTYSQEEIRDVKGKLRGLR